LVGAVGAIVAVWRVLASAEDIADVLEREFEIALPDPREELLAALARLPA